MPEKGTPEYVIWKMKYEATQERKKVEARLQELEKQVHDLREEIEKLKNLVKK